MATFEGLCWFDGVYTYISGCPLRLYQKFGQFCGGRVPALPKNVGANHRVTCVLSTCRKSIKKNIRLVQITSTMWKLLRRCRVFPMIYPCGKSYPTGHFMNQLCWLEGGRLFLLFNSFLYRTAPPPAFQHGPSWWSIAPVPWYLFYWVYPTYSGGLEDI